MTLHVIFGNLVRDPLEAEIMYQSVENRGGVVPFNCGAQILIMKFFEQVE